MFYVLAFVYGFGIVFSFLRVRRALAVTAGVPYRDPLDDVLDGLTLVAVPFLWPLAALGAGFFLACAWIGTWARKG